MKKNILLTGCAGFIGTNFVKNICSDPSVARGYNFLILDLLTYAGHYLSIQDDVENNENISFIKLDIRNSQAIQNVFSKNKFDGVIHFAAESHVDNSIKAPTVFVETNVLGTLHLLNASLGAQSITPDFRFVHVSTDEVYGTLTEDEPAFTENHPLRPNSPYSASKAASDLLVRSYVETYQLNACITRCSNNYGPYQLPEKLIPVAITKSFAHQAVPVYGNGRNIRDWIFVTDHVRGIWLTYLNGKNGEIYNFGGDSEKRNIDVVTSILLQLGRSELDVEWVPDRKGHDWRYAMDSTKAARELDWHPQVKFEDGLKVTIEWYQKNTAWLKSVQTQ